MQMTTRGIVRLCVLPISAGLWFMMGCTETPRAAEPGTILAPSWRRLATHRWPTLDGAITLRFAPDAVGPPTVHTIVDAGDVAAELWYLPWVHDHPNLAAEPLPTPYVAALADALVSFGAQMDVVGVEGELWEWNLRERDVSQYAREIISPDDIAVVRVAHAEVGDMECSMDAEQPPTDVERATYELHSRTTTPVIGVEDPDLMIQKTGAENPTLDRDRSNTAVVVLLAELRARAGHRALLIFGMAHYAEIEDEVRKLGNVTLRAACIPALCETEQPAPHETIVPDAPE